MEYYREQLMLLADLLEATSVRNFERCAEIARELEQVNLGIRKFEVDYEECE